MCVTDTPFWAERLGFNNVTGIFQTQLYSKLLLRFQKCVMAYAPPIRPRFMARYKSAMID